MPDISRALSIRGWMPPRELRYIAEQALLREAILEVGTFVGRTTRALVDNCPGFVYSIDPLRPCRQDGSLHAKELQTVADCKRIEKEQTRNLQDAENLVLIRGTVLDLEVSLGIYPLPKPGLFDMVFIDGDHSYEAVRQDITIAMHFMVPGGLLLGDDYWINGVHPGVRTAVDEIFQDRIERPCGKLWKVQL